MPEAISHHPRPDDLPVRGRCALVTGASSGLGKEFATVLAEQGAHLVLVARRLEPMQRLAADLQARHGGRVSVQAMDLSLPGAAARLKETLDARGISVDVLVNNAGLGLIGDFIDQPLDQLTGMLQLNMVALTELTHVFAQGMKTRGGGHILLVGSVGGFQPTPTYAAYSATKAYVLSFGEALHAELAAQGVVVTVLSPGVTESEFFLAAGQEPTPAQKRMMMKARPVAEIGLAALFQKKSGVIAGTFNKMLTLSTRLFSRRFMARAGYKMLKP